MDSLVLFIKNVVPKHYLPAEIGISASKYIYSENIEVLPSPKIEDKIDLSITLGGWKLVWTRLQDPVIDLEARDTYFKLLHNCLPTRQRLFLRNKAPDPYCSRETVRRLVHGPLLPGSIREKIAVGGCLGDIVHTFVQCKRVAGVWGWTRRLLLKFLHSDWSNLSDLELLFLTWPKYTEDQTMLWILSQYIHYIWLQDRKIITNIQLAPFIGYLSNKFKQHHIARRPPLTGIVFDSG